VVESAAQPTHATANQNGGQRRIGVKASGKTNARTDATPSSSPRAIELGA
jgi:hypothetical protein